MSNPTPLFDSIPRTIVTSILSYVTSNDWLNFRIVSRSCYEIVHEADSGEDSEKDESLWKLALIRDYQFEDVGNCLSMRQTFTCSNYNDDDDEDDDSAFLSTKDMFTAATYFIAWKHWREIDLRFPITERRRLFGQRKDNVPQSEGINGPYFIRACNMWKKIEEWCGDKSKSGTVGRDIKESLLPGKAIEPNIYGRKYDGEPGHTSAFKAIYAFYSGQRSLDHDYLQQYAKPFGGLFGGWSAYDMVSNVRMVEIGTIESRMPLLTIAADINRSKAFALDMRSGRVILEGDEQLNAIFDLVQPDSALLIWFEEHASRLTKNFYSVGNIQDYESILRYPSIADIENCSRAVTRGVEVVASSVFALEMGMFVYSIRIRLLVPEDEGYMSPDERGFETCQLISRHWIIKDGSNHTEEVRGDGVIGQYPLLHEGGFTNFEGSGIHTLEEQEHSTDGTFSYQSASGGSSGSFEGYLQFRPGRLEQPTGEDFDVRVAPFPLKLTQFMY